MSHNGNRVYALKLALVLPILLVPIALETWLLIEVYQWVERDLCSIEHQASGHCYAPWFDSFERWYFPIQFSLLLVSALLGFVGLLVLWLDVCLKRALIFGLALCLFGYAYVYVISSGLLWQSQCVSLLLAFVTAGFLWRRFKVPKNIS